MSTRMIVTVSFCVMAIPPPAGAQENSVGRPQFEFAVGLSYLQSESTAFEGGTVVDTESTTGIGLHFDWRFADRWTAGATLAMHDIDYTANIALVGSPLGAPGQVVRNDLDTQSVMGHTKRYFGSWDRVAPYATGGLGWVSIDTNVPTGPPIGYCWFDPWWGLACDSFQPTRTTTELGTILGVGVRWEFSRRLFLDASIGREWIDFDNGNRPDFTQVRVAFGLHEGDRDSRRSRNVANRAR